MDSISSSPARDSESIWNFEDLVLFLAAILPSLLLSALLLRLGQNALPGVFAAQAIRQLTYQSALYVFLMGSLVASVKFRHRESVRNAFALRPQFRGAWVCVLGAPFLAVGNATLGALLRAPAVPNPAEQLMEGRASIVLVGCFVVLLGPLVEELVFRGFLQPLLQRYLGAWPAVVGAAIPFALLHGAQNGWTWQSLLLIGFAGVVFGAARLNTRSTVASMLLHSSYNLTLFTAYIVQSGRW